MPQLASDAPAPIRVFDARELLQTTVPALDGALARAPSFSLFRRSSSLASHPTTHGVSLRGIGASGASRTLVLVDGVPENDGFGNWVHWSTLPLLQIERVELTGSGLSTLYGSSALAGAIAVVTRHPPGDALDVRASAGSLGTGEVEGVRRTRKRRRLAAVRRGTRVPDRRIHPGRPRGARPGRRGGASAARDAELARGTRAERCRRLTHRSAVLRYASERHAATGQRHSRSAFHGRHPCRGEGRGVSGGWLRARPAIPEHVYGNRCGSRFRVADPCAACAVPGRRRRRTVVAWLVQPLADSRWRPPRRRRNRRGRGVRERHPYARPRHRGEPARRRRVRAGRLADR